MISMTYQKDVLDHERCVEFIVKFGPKQWKASLQTLENEHIKMVHEKRKPNLCDKDA